MLKHTRQFVRQGVQPRPIPARLSNLGSFPEQNEVMTKSILATKKKNMKQDKKDKSVWSNHYKTAKPGLIAKSHLKTPSLRKATSCTSVDKCVDSPSDVGPCPSDVCQCPSDVCQYSRDVCQCPICTRFDSVFPPNKRMYNRSDQTSCIQTTRTRTCPVMAEERPSQEPITTSNVHPYLSHTKSTIALRDKEAFKLYAKSLSDVCPIHPSSQKKSHQVFDELNYSKHPQLFCDSNVYFTSQWKHITDLNKSSRYLFYAQLENFYRQLYTRAKANTVAYSS
ncbi:hypothetical protein WDU94_005312 [Cyamophila willieti]